MRANGTADEPVIFRGDRLDHIVGSTSFDIMSGQWGGVIFTPPTMGNVLNHVIMKGSSIGMHCSANGDTTQCALKLVNCVLTNSSSTCLATATCYVKLIGTEISDAAEEVGYFAGGKVEATQCTFANYYLFKVPSLPIVNVFDVEYSNGTIGIYSEDLDITLLYLHCKDIQVKRGDVVMASDVIGYEGGKGLVAGIYNNAQYKKKGVKHTTGSHYVHVELRKGRQTTSNKYTNAKLESDCPYEYMRQALNIPESGRQPVTQAAVNQAQRMREEAEARARAEAAAAAAAAAEAEATPEPEIEIVEEPEADSVYGFSEPEDSSEPEAETTPAPEATLPPAGA